MTSGLQIGFQAVPKFEASIFGNFSSPIAGVGNFRRFLLGALRIFKLHASRVNDAGTFVEFLSLINANWRVG